MPSENDLFIRFITEFPNLTLNAVALFFLWLVWKELQRFITFTMGLIERDRAEREIMAEELGLDYRSLVIEARKRRLGDMTAEQSANEDTRELPIDPKIVKRDSRFY